MTHLGHSASPLFGGLALLLAFVPVGLVGWQVRRAERAARVEAARSELARMATALDAAVRTRSPRTRGQLNDMLERARLAGGGRIAWIQIRHTGGAVIAHAGLPAAPAFRLDAVRAQFRDGRPVFRTVATPVGDAVVEAFPFELPVAIVPAGAAGAAGDGVAEIAVFLTRPASARPTFPAWPPTRALTCLKA